MPIMKKTMILWLLIAASFTSCTSMGSKGEIIPTPSARIAVTGSMTATMSAISPLSTSTITPMLPSSTPTILPTIPTLPDDAAYQLLNTMLHANKTCELPCWLHVTPGKSSLADVYLEWAPLQGITATYADFPATDKGKMDFVYDMNSDELKVFTSYSVSRSTDIIESIDVFTEATHNLGNDQFEDAYTAKIYSNNLSEYLLSNILSTYGQPAQILLSMEIINAEPTSPDFFYIWLLYPERGAILKYQGSADIRANSIYGCPLQTFVSLWLVSPNDVELYKKTLTDATGVDWNDLVPTSAFYKSTEDAIGMSSQEFYETFKSPTGRCIKSPLNIWPEH